MIRKGNLMVTNYWIDEKGKKQSLQSHLGDPKYSHWEIKRIEQNEYFGKEQEYREMGYEDSFGGDFLTNGTRSIQKSFFTDPEMHFVIARWTSIDHDEKSPDLQYVGNRPFNMSVEDQRTFMVLAKLGQEELERQLYDFNEDEF